jgi:hypothetical protein
MCRQGKKRGFALGLFPKLANARETFLVIALTQNKNYWGVVSLPCYSQGGGVRWSNRGGSFLCRILKGSPM